VQRLGLRSRSGELAVVMAPGNTEGQNLPGSQVPAIWNRQKVNCSLKHFVGVRPVTSLSNFPSVNGASDMITEFVRRGKIGCERPGSPRLHLRKKRRLVGFTGDARLCKCEQRKAIPGFSEFFMRRRQFRDIFWAVAFSDQKHDSVRLSHAFQACSLRRFRRGRKFFRPHNGVPESGNCRGCSSSEIFVTYDHGTEKYFHVAKLVLNTGSAGVQLRLVPGKRVLKPFRSMQYALLR
jgi:hypothetical protein